MISRFSSAERLTNRPTGCPCQASFFSARGFLGTIQQLSLSVAHSPASSTVLPDHLHAALCHPANAACLLREIPSTTCNTCWDGCLRDGTVLRSCLLPVSLPGRCGSFLRLSISCASSVEFLIQSFRRSSFRS